MTLEAWVRPTHASTTGTPCCSRSSRRSSRTRSTAAPTAAARPATSIPAAPAATSGRAARRRWPSTRGRTSRSRWDGATARLYVNGTQAATSRDRRHRRGLVVAAAHRRQHDLGRVLRRPDRRGADLQPRADRRRDRHRHEHAGRAAGHAGADRARRNLTATGSLTSAQLELDRRRPTTPAWPATTSTARRSPGFTPSAANRIAQPTGTSYTDTPSGGTYYYKVTAEDAVGNVSAASNEASATAGDLVAPSAPGTLTAIGAIGKATLTWGAATDNVAVVRYNVHRGTTSGFTPSAANRIAQPTGTTLHRRDDPRDLLLQGHRRGRRRQRRPRLERGERDDHDRHAGADRARPA